MEVKLDGKGSFAFPALGEYGLKIWNPLKEKKEIPQEKKINLPKKKRTLLIGWDSADWNMINHMMSRGQMPTLEKFLIDGASGNISTLDPSFSPMLWTSIASGKYANKHGILGFTELNENIQEIRPIQSSSRKCHALWNILESQGLKSNVIGWWPSHPAEPISGTMVTNQFHKIRHQANGKKIWMDQSSVYPKSMHEQLAKLRVHTSDLTEAHILPFVPNAAKVNQDEDKSLSKLGDSIAQLATIQNVTTYLMQQTDWDLTAVYFNDMDTLSHLFGRYTAPKMEHISEEQFETYNGVIEGVYRFHDMMLHRILELAGENTNVILLSDHGFKLRDQKLKGLPKLPAAIAYEHNHHGILCMKGPDIKANTEIFNASLLDITPTILDMLKLPVGDDMDGKILTTVLKNQSNISSIPTWEEVSGNFGRHPKELQIDTIAAKEAMDQLVALGYIEELDDDAEEAFENLMKETKYNLSRVYLDQNKKEESTQLLEEMYALDKVDPRINKDLIDRYTEKKEFQKALKILSDFKKFDVSKLFDFDHLEGNIKISMGDYEGAEEALFKAYENKPNIPHIQGDIGVLFSKKQNYKQAEYWLKKALENDRTNAFFLNNLGIVNLKQNKIETALEILLETLEIKPDYPATHYHIGVCLYKLDNFQKAAQAFETCLHLNPGVNRARNMLLNIYRYYHPDKKKYQIYRSFFDETRRGEVIIVTGLPRSGTSMIMQMLDHGGIETYTDGLRKADENNPNGYFESEDIKSSAKDNSWLENAIGKAAKVVTPLIPSLNLNYSFKVIWIERNMTDVLLSQEEMLTRKNPNRKKVLNLALKEQYEKMIKRANSYIEERNNIEMLKLNYEDAIKEPLKVAEKIHDFLAYKGDINRMASAIDPKLQRITSENALT